MGFRPHFLGLMFLAVSLTNCSCDEVVVVQVAARIQLSVPEGDQVSPLCEGDSTNCQLAFGEVPLATWTERVVHVKNPVKFFALNVVVASFGVIPGAASATCVTAGILYGTLWGMALCVTSASVGAMVSFTLSRYVARPWVEKMFVRHGGRFKALDDAVSNDGSQIVILVRLSPFSPFTVASYMLGLTSVPFVSYAAATLVGLLPSSFVYVYIGDTGRRASGSEGATAIEIVFYVLGLLMTLFVSYRIAVIAQDAMRAKVGLDWDPSTDSDEEVELDVFGSRIDEEVEGAPLEDDGDDRDKPNTIL